MLALLVLWLMLLLLVVAIVVACAAVLALVCDAVGLLAFAAGGFCFQTKSGRNSGPSKKLKNKSRLGPEGKVRHVKECAFCHSYLVQYVPAIKKRSSSERLLSGGTN